MTRRQRIAFIILHSASSYYLGPLLRAGRLPNLQRIARSGASGTIFAPLPPGDGTWITLYTGLEPDQSGLISLLKIDARRVPPVWLDTVDSATFQEETVLSIASKAGLRVAAVNAPSLAPPWPVNGVLIPGPPQQDEVRPATFPPELRDEIGPMNRCNLTEVNISDIGACREYLDANLARSLEVSKRVYAKDAFDLFVTTFNTPDYAHHFFHENPAAGSGWGNLIDEYHEKLDVAIGELEQCVSADTTLFIGSERGCGPFPRFSFHANSWLESRGLLQRRWGAMSSTRFMATLRSAYDVALRTGLATTVKRLLPRAWTATGRNLTDHWAFVDFGTTRAYAVEHFYPFLGIEINVRGRQPAGVITTGPEYENVRGAIIDALRQMTVPGTSRPLCLTVGRREELFRGEHAELIGDVVAELDPEVESTHLLGHGIFQSNHGHPIIPFRGYHTTDGILYVRGQGVQAGSKIPEMKMCDLFPTLLTLLDIPVPPNRRGSVIPPFARITPLEPGPP